MDALVGSCYRSASRHLSRIPRKGFSQLAPPHGVHFMCSLGTRKETLRVDVCARLAIGAHRYGIWKLEVERQSSKRWFDVSQPSVSRWFFLCSFGSVDSLDCNFFAQRTAPAADAGIIEPNKKLLPCVRCEVLQCEMNCRSEIDYTIQFLFARYSAYPRSPK